MRDPKLGPIGAAKLKAGVEAGLAPWSAAHPGDGGDTLVVRTELEAVHPAQARDGVDAFIRGRDQNLVRLRLELDCPERETYTVRRATEQRNWLGGHKHVREEHERTVLHACGELFWQTYGDEPLETLLEKAGAGAAAELSARMLERTGQFVTRNAADERFFLMPSALTLEPGEVELSNDEVLLFGLGVGVSHRVELNLRLGGLFLPAAGATVLPPFGIAGAAGAAVMGALDLGAKVRVIDEARAWPGVAVAYEMLDLFGAALGGAGLLGYGIGGVAAGGALNVQLNVLSVAANKHFFDVLQVGGGTLVVDNHHFLPQGVALAIAAGEGTQGGVSGGATAIPRFPTRAVPFLNAEWAPFSWLHFIQEASPGFEWQERFGTTGLRLVLGGDEDGEWVAWSKIRVRLDGAILETHDRHGWHGLPWLGFALYKL